jgi:hypothetical protein
MVSFYLRSVYSPNAHSVGGPPCIHTCMVPHQEHLCHGMMQYMGSAKVTQGFYWLRQNCQPGDDREDRISLALRRETA